MIGAEKKVGEEGNAPYFLYNYLPMDIAFASVMFEPLAGAPFPPISMPFTPTGILLWLVIIFTIASTIQIIIQIVLRYRFRNPYTSPELEHILTKVRSKMNLKSSVEVWLLESDKTVLVPLSGIFYRALVISKSAEDDLLASPDMAELVLADNLESVQELPLLSTWIPITLMVFPSFMWVRWTGLTIEQIVAVSWALFWVLVIISGKQLLVGRGEEKCTVLETYGTHPDVARCVVFRGSPPTYHDKKEIFKQLHDPLSKEVNRTKRYKVFFVALVIALFTGYILTSWVSNFTPIEFPPINILVQLLPMLVSLLLFEGLFSYRTRSRYEIVDLPSTS